MRRKYFKVTTLISVVILLVLFIVNYLGIAKYKGIYKEAESDRGREMLKFQRINSSGGISNNLTTSKDSKKINPSWDILMDQRKNFIVDKCGNFSNTDYWKNISPAGDLFTYGGITYCQTPKVGCTYWLRILRFMAKDFTIGSSEVLKPSDIDRFQVHFDKFRNIVRSRFNIPQGNLMLSSTRSFMFTRHPLTRLWSAYVDKFLLPDFWRLDAVDIADVMRQKHTKCVSDLSFQEFLIFIAITPAEKLDNHWKPVHLLCSPCHTKFDVIGKQETFSRDSAFIIDKFGLSGVKENLDKDTRTRKEIEMLVDYNLAFTKKKGSRCFPVTKISQRLWTAFQINGYIHRNISFPEILLNEETLSRNASTVLLEIIFKTIELHSDDMKNDLKHQRRYLMKEAYKSLPSTLLDRILKIYKYDFELFQYDVDI